MAVQVATKSFTCNKHFSKIWSVLVLFAQIGRAMAVEEESGRNMRTHLHSKRTNGKYAHSSKISQNNLWLLKGVFNKKLTIKKLPTELPLCSTSSVRQEKKWPQFLSKYLYEMNFVEILKAPGVISELWGVENEQKISPDNIFLRKCELLPVAPLPWKDRSALDRRTPRAFAEH